MKLLTVVAPRGIGLLQAMQPEARGQVEILTDLVVTSQIDKVAVNVLCDGSFGWDQDYLLSLATKMSQDGRNVHFLLYLANGPGSRLWKDNLYPGVFGTDIDPGEFREKILSDEQFQKDYQDLFRRVIPIIRAIQNMNGIVRVVPQLEDNQTDETFKKMVDLIQDVTPEDLSVELGRNPCVNCYPGNSGTIPEGLFAEYHLHSGKPDFEYSNGVATNDGCTYAFPGEEPDYDCWHKLDTYRKVQSRAGHQNDWFLLWSAKFQGLGRTPITPSQRDYVKPTAAEQELLVGFLADNT